MVRTAFQFLWITAWLIGFSAPVFAVEITAHVDRTNISSSDSVNLTITISDGEGEVDLSAITDFNVVSQGSGSGIRIINGAMTRESSYRYTLVPLRKGTLQIPGLPVEVDGKAFKTEAIAVTVSDHQETKDEFRDIFITASVSTDKPYVGQPFTYKVTIFHAPRIVNAGFQPPEFSGLDAKKIEKERSFTRIIQSRQYNVIELAYVLIPLKAGRISIDPAVLSCDVVGRNPGRSSSFDSFFNDPFFGGNRLEHKTLSTEALAVESVPLPPYTEDIPFSGLVGTFDLKSASERTTLSVGDAVTLSVTLSGSGNIMDAGDPEVSIPESFKVYPDTPEEQIEFNENGYSGTKTFKKALVPVKEGDYTVPSVKYCYFDLPSGEYRILQSAPISFHISPGTEPVGSRTGKQSAALPPSRDEKKEVQFVGHDILPLKDEPDAVLAQSGFSFPVFLLFMLIPAAGFGAIWVLGKTMNKPTHATFLMAGRAEISLKKAGKAGITEDEFLAALYTALVSSALSKAGVKGESLTGAELKGILAESPEGMAEAAADLLTRIEAARFGGGRLDPSEKSRMLADTRKIFRSLCK